MTNKNNDLKLSGFAFGVTSGVITTLGTIVGVSSATGGSKLAVIAAIITVAFADAFSDAFGMHLAEESRQDDKHQPIWIASLSVFVGKILFSTIFIAPILLFSNSRAITFSVALGLIILAIQAAYNANKNKSSIAKNVAEHLGVAVFVLTISYYLGRLAEYIASVC